VNSGTEASMSAIRLARGVTGKQKIVKFNGCYHGHCDSLLVAAGSGGLTLSVPDSAGVLDSVASDTLVLDYNDAEGVTALFEREGQSISSVILEPICGNMGVIYPTTLFLNSLKEACKKFGALLIFDEVMCGYRTDKTSASNLFDIIPDITILGKVIGGGLPCGAYGGKQEIMNFISPEGPVYQAGTLSGNPLVMAAGIKTLELLKERNVIDVLSKRCAEFASDINQYISQKGLDLSVVYSGSMFSLFFSSTIPQNLSDVQKTNISAFPQFYKNMLNEGIYLAPSAYESNFLSLCHDEALLEKTSNSIKKSLIL
jgi:glutamate-1-semialdehyde 2,1-aminomutase